MKNLRLPPPLPPQSTSGVTSLQGTSLVFTGHTTNLPVHFDFKFDANLVGQYQGLLVLSAALSSVLLCAERQYRQSCAGLDL